MSDLAEWMKAAEALRTAEFMSGFVMECLSGKGADHQAEDAAIVHDRIKAAISALDEVRPGFASLVNQAALEAERRAAMMGPRPN